MPKRNKISGQIRLGVPHSTWKCTTGFAKDFVGRTKVFTLLQRPRILWAGVSGDVDHLELQVACVESALSQLGFAQEDRLYHPHLTLSRIKSNFREIGKILETSDLFKKEWVFGELAVNRLCFFQSQLTPRGAIYSRL